MKKLIIQTILKVGGEKLLQKFRIANFFLNIKMGMHRRYEREFSLLPYFVSNGDVCIDIGANFGMYTYDLSKLVGATGKVYSFEPGNFAFNVLIKTIKNFDLKNVYAYNIALGDKVVYKNLIIPFNQDKSVAYGLAHFLINEKKEGIIEEIPTSTLDQFVLENDLKKVKFIKCDVEGAELPIFKGGESLLLKHRPIILCEIEPRHTKRFGYTPNELINFLAKFGYRLFILDDDKRLKSVAEVTKDINNYIFIAK